jgi:heme A synthase
MYLAVDTVNRALSSGMFWAGLGIGALTGGAFVRMKSAWTGHKKIKETIPALRKAAWAGVGRFTWFALVLVALVIVTVAWVSGRHANLTQTGNPQPIPSSSPSHR